MQPTVTQVPDTKALWPRLQSMAVSKTPQRFVVDDSYSYIKTLGTGAYGVVISAHDARTNTNVAIKKVKDAWADPDDGLRILREITMLQHLNHHNIVRLLDLGVPEQGQPLNDIYMTMELCDTDLRKIICSGQPLSSEQIGFFIYQVCKALKYIHSCGIVHRDLKPGNLVVNRDCTLKVCDFGLARCLNNLASEPAQKLTEYVVTRWYRAPELLCSMRNYDAKIDMWSVGCILGELLARKPIFPGSSVSNQVELILNVVGTPKDLSWISCAPARQFVEAYQVPGQRWQDLLPGASAQALDLLDQLLQFDPSKRISAEQALEHPFLAAFHDLKTEPRCSRPFYAPFDRVQPRTRTMLQDYAWEEIYKFRPALRPLGPSRTEKYLTPAKPASTHATACTAASAVAAAVVSACPLPRPRPAGLKRKASVGANLAAAVADSHMGKAAPRCDDRPLKAAVPASVAIAFAHARQRSNSQTVNISKSPESASAMSVSSSDSDHDSDSRSGTPDLLDNSPMPMEHSPTHR